MRVFKPRGEAEWFKRAPRACNSINHDKAIIVDKGLALFTRFQDRKLKFCHVFAEIKSAKYKRIIQYA